jgi:hypothetical protein
MLHTVYAENLKKYYAGNLELPNHAYELGRENNIVLKKFKSK